MQIQIEHKSIIGTRADQQDAYYVSSSEDKAFAVVCDGMGGTAGGEVASKTAVNKLRELIDNKDPIEPFPLFFLRAIDILDECVVTINKQFGSEGSGTTIAAATIEKGCLYWLAVGDSRIYIVRGDEIVQATRDHNYALRLDHWTAEEQKTEQALPGNHRSDALISYIGIGGIRIFDINEKPFSLFPGDLVLLTTDGLTNTLTNNEIMSQLTANQYPKRLDMLFETVSKKQPGVQDNTTCVLLHIANGGITDVCE